MATRTHAREAVIALLYAYESGNSDIRKFAPNILNERKIRNAQERFALGLFDGIIAHLEKIDEMIKAALKGWDFERISALDKAIIRLGVYEIVFAKIDVAVAINEALELAKTFGSGNTLKFINGILDSVGKNAQKDAL